MYLNIAKDFSDTPGPRSREEGEFSGDQFLQDLLRPMYLKAKEKKEELTVDLDGTEGYATSFLEAAFGGLAREFASEEIFGVIRFKCDDEPYLEEEIKRYIKEARR
jgi:hypothetical protein